MVRPASGTCSTFPSSAADAGRGWQCLVWTGGRQIDGAIGSFTALEKITASSRVHGAQQQGKFTVLFDSGIRKGSDIIKAIAMGAQGVLSEHTFLLSIGNERIS